MELGGTRKLTAVMFIIRRFTNRIIDDSRTKLRHEYNKLCDDLAKRSGLYQKYQAFDWRWTGIGNCIWVMWYQGYDSAPTLAKKCVSRMRELDGTDVVFLDKDNLTDFRLFVHESE